MEGNAVAVCDCQEMQKKNEGRNRILVISTAVQWIFTVLCIACLAILFHKLNAEEQKQIKEKRYIFTRISSEINDYKKINLTHENGNLKVEKGSVFIAVDGHYLIYLEGCLKDPGNNTVNVWKRDEQGNIALLVRESTKEGCLRTMMIKDLMEKHEIYIEKDVPGIKFTNFTLVLYCLGSKKGEFGLHC